MTDLTEKILTLLREDGIGKKEALEKLAAVYGEIELSLWETFKVNPVFFYGLKDIVWYNLEHLPSGGEERGLSNLRFLGTKFPYFIYSFNDNEYIPANELPLVIGELDQIAAQWDKRWRLASLYASVPVGWQGGDNPSKIVIHERTESPKKYMAPVVPSRMSRILGPNGDQIKTQAQRPDEYQVFCGLDDEIGEYGQGPIIYGVLIQLREACRLAMQSGKELRIEFED